MNKTETPIPIQGSGINWAIQQINQKTIRELVKGTRRPIARKSNEFDEPPVCPVCNGDKRIWSEEYQEEYDCNGCGGEGSLTFEKQPCVFLMVYRDFRSIECEVQLDEHGKYKEAFVTVAEGEFRSGESINLTLEEIAEAEEELKR